MKIDKRNLLDFLDKQNGDVVAKHNLMALDSVCVLDVGDVLAQKVDFISFLVKSARSAAEMYERSKARVLIVDAELNLDPSIKQSCCLIEVTKARLFFCELLNELKDDGLNESNRLNAIIDVNSSISDSVYIGSNCVIESGVVIGEGSHISDNVVIKRNVVIGKNVLIHPGAVLGTDGFGYEKRRDGSYVKFTHIGTVVIEDDVEIGANTVIDRGTLSETRIGSGTKIDNLVHIAHNVTIGKNCLVIAQAMLAGGVKIDDGVWVGPSSSILDKVRIGRGAFVGMGVPVIRNIKDGDKYTVWNFLQLFSRKSR